MPIVMPLKHVCMYVCMYVNAKKTAWENTHHTGHRILNGWTKDSEQRQF